MPDTTPLEVYIAGGIVCLIMLVLLIWILIVFCTGLFGALTVMMRTATTMFPHPPITHQPPPTQQYTPPMQPYNGRGEPRGYGGETEY